MPTSAGFSVKEWKGEKFAGIACVPRLSKLPPKRDEIITNLQCGVNPLRIVLDNQLPIQCRFFQISG